MITTSLKYFTQVLSVISEFNISEEDCLSAAELRKAPNTDRVKVETLTRILNFAATNLDEPLMGIKCGLKYPILQYTRPSEFLKLCEDLNHAADVYAKYCPLFHNVGKPIGIISENRIDRMIWVPHFDQNLIADYRQLVEFIMTNLMTSITWLAWKTPNPVERLNIKHEASLPLKHYEKLFGCDVKFDQEEYSLILKTGVKDAAFSTANQEELTKVCLVYDLALNKLYKNESLVDRIELEIRRSIEDGNASKASVAKTLGLSQRTMARDLKIEGTCFKDIKNNVLKNLALAKISQGLPLAEVAQSLGYNDQPAFTRAYKKWFGTTPGKHIASKG